MTTWHPFEGPVHSFYAQAAQNATVTQAGRDLIVQQTGPPWRIDALPLRPRVTALRDAQAPQQPSRLLRTRDEVVDFTGRRREIESFAEWRDAGDAFLIRLVHGPGGEGKTRLARHLAREWGKEGWLPLQARHATECLGAPPGIVAKAAESVTGVLVVVDYAERWPGPDLLGMIQQAKDHWEAPTRVLLLSRPAGVWWEGIKYHIDKQLDLDAGALRLAPLGVRPEDREEIFRAACKAFGSRFGLADPSEIGLPAGLLTNTAYSLVLTLHMAALAAVDAHHRGASAPENPSVLSLYLLQRERDYWTTLYENNRARTDPESINCAVYAASLCGPVTHSTANAIVTRLGIATDVESARKVIRDHTYCYPAVQDRADSFLEPLHPDRLAEDFIALTLPGHTLDYTADAWATEATTKVLTPGAEEAPGNTRRALTVLIEMATRWRHIAVDHLAPFLKAHPEAVLQCESASVVTLADNPHIGVDVLQAMEPVLKKYRGQGLATGILAVLHRIAKDRLSKTQDPAERAAIHHDLSSAYHYAGLYGQAAEAARQEIGTRRLLAEADPAAHRPALAGALLNLCAVLTEQERHSEAHAAATEALAIRRELRTADVTAPAGETGHTFAVLVLVPTWMPFEAPLALSLLHYAWWLLQEAGPSQATDVCEEAVGTLRRLAEEGPGHEDSLAWALLTLANILMDGRRLDGALRSASESVDMYRELARQNDEFDWYLAYALSQVGEIHRRMYRLSAAQLSVREAVTVARRFAARQPGNEAVLGYALRVLSECLGESGGPRLALETSTEALRAYRSLYHRDERQRGKLAADLSSHAGVLMQCGYMDSAVEIALEGLELARETMSRDQRLLVEALSSLMEVQTGEGDLEEALRTARETVDNAKELGDRLPHTRWRLAQALGKMSDILFMLGRLAEADECGARALKVYQTYAAAHAPHPLVEARLCVFRLKSMVIFDSSSDETAVTDLLEHTANLCRDIGPAAEELLATTLYLAAMRHDQRGREDEAVGLAGEAVALFRGRAVENAMEKIELALCLQLLGRIRFDMDPADPEGLRAMEEAKTIVKDASRTLPRAAPILLQILSDLGYAYADLNRRGMALSTTREAAELADRAHPQGILIVLTPLALAAFASVRLFFLIELPEALRAAEHALAICAEQAGLVPVPEGVADELRELVADIRDALRQA
ncbi:hypothetical protein ACIGMX_41690 [Streptomyces aquilus]|uniref:hypothetical protein n=1 Tax=Streptomyces aquilus TaxID=2548456 RepID=UPI0037D7FA0A